MGGSRTYVAKQPRVRPQGRSGDGVESGVEDPPDLRWWSRRRGAWASADGGRGSPAEMAAGGEMRPGHLGEAPVDKCCRRRPSSCRHRGPSPSRRRGPSRGRRRVLPGHRRAGEDLPPPLAGHLTRPDAWHPAELRGGGRKGRGGGGSTGGRRICGEADWLWRE